MNHNILNKIMFHIHRRQWQDKMDQVNQEFHQNVMPIYGYHPKIVLYGICVKQNNKRCKYIGDASGKYCYDMHLHILSKCNNCRRF